jgi:hypothetical protein
LPRDLPRQAEIARRKISKLEKAFPLTKVPFLYEAGDYYCIPGLVRDWDDGFLTPVFINKMVLLKYDADPAYQVSFASTTCGNIDMPNSETGDSHAPDLTPGF